MFNLFQVKIPCKPNHTLSDDHMTQFLQTICRTCQSCENLITLDPGPEQCEKCAAEEEKETLREKKEEIERNEKSCRDQLKKTIKYETESDSSNSDRPLKYTIKKVKNEYAFENDNDNELMTIDDASDVESTEEQEENVSSTTAAAITTNTTTTTASVSLSIAGSATRSTSASKLPVGSPQEWTVEGVIKFIADTDPALAVHAELFRKHVSIYSSEKLPLFKVELNIMFDYFSGN